MWCFCPINNLLEKLFDVHRFYVLSPVLIQNLSSPALFSHCPAFSFSCTVFSSSSLFFSPMMSINAAIGASSKNLGDLSKNTPEVNDVMLAILRAVEHVGAHKATGRKKSDQILSHFPASVRPLVIHSAPSPMRRLHVWTTRWLQNLWWEPKNNVWLRMIPTK